ncbi:DUF3311 domain-containing protein [Sphingomonas hengshuiensis]|uniref:DUF3311 domain-containing protein n=1 Tax=Sphingomonas hengshuiensis TaxID=1609977 RepID=UPI0005CA96CC|nr:DUF3311 domain-containing protein [Sphingomonas hengshuiensis]
MISDIEPEPRRRPHRWLLLIPFLWQVAMIPVVNDVAWRPLSLPFPMAWQMVGIVVASIVIAIVYAIDRRHPEFAADADTLPGSGAGH